MSSVFKTIRRFFLYLWVTFILLMLFGLFLMIIEELTGLDLDNIGTFIVITILSFYLSYHIVYKKLQQWKKKVIDKFKKRK